MVTTTPIENTEDIIDSRDILRRIEYLEDQVSDCEHVDPELAAEDDVIECGLWEDHEELQMLQKFIQTLRDDAGIYGNTPEDGITLISDRYFDGSFAEQEAEDLGMVSGDLSRWPFTCIDWNKAAEELQQEYTMVDFDGATYWAK